MTSWLDRWFSGFHWYRKWCGGHWEKWYVALADCEGWLQTDRCFHDGAKRPSPLCLGAPLVCETYPEWMFIDPKDWW
jgi:hypothetical protein